jgi:hypothetical protein
MRQNLSQPVPRRAKPVEAPGYNKDTRTWPGR